MIEIVLPWPKALRPNVGRKVGQSERTGHEKEDKAAAVKATGEAVAAIEAKGLTPHVFSQEKQNILYVIEYWPPMRHGWDSDAVVSVHKAMRDGIALVLDVDDSRFYPLVVLPPHEAVAGGRLVVKVGQDWLDWLDEQSRFGRGAGGARD